MGKNIYRTLGIFLLIIIALGLFLFLREKPKPTQTKAVTNFIECSNAGFPVQEKYPRVCTDNEGISFEEVIEDEGEKQELIILESPLANTLVKNPIELKGRARGYWFFEGSFPVVVVNWDGLIIGEGFATAQGEWMTESYVPFTATVQYDLDPETYSKNGGLILQKDNPSGLPENDDALEIPIVFE